MKVMGYKREYKLSGGQTNFIWVQTVCGSCYEVAGKTVFQDESNDT